MTRWLLAIAIVTASACSKPAPGSENGDSYPNDTCNAGLVCASGFCVQSGSGDGAVGDDLSVGGLDGSTMDSATADAARYDDAGLPCPGANIFHPGTETRMANTSVPFVGRARDPMCNALTGTNLVWTDSLEGQIGTGETFNHTFTMTGSHTVTLDAKDAANDYFASVTFLIN